MAPSQSSSPTTASSQRQRCAKNSRPNTVPAALVDAGPLVAVFGRKQPDAARYHALFKLASDELWSLATTWPCVVEASYLVDPPQRYTLLRWVGSGAVSVFPFGQEALESMVENMRRYTQSPRTEMDLADASLVW